MILILTIIILIIIAACFLIGAYKIFNQNSSQISTIEHPYRRNIREVNFTYLQDKIDKSDWEKEDEAFKQH